VFAVAGWGAREAVQDLRSHPELRIVDSPRAASILLIAGFVPDALVEPLAHVHDQVPHPRATARWQAGTATATPLEGFPEHVSISGSDVVAGLVELQRDLLASRRTSEGPILPDVDLVPWRGVGPYGQGGGGMTGGTPYGRPMAGLGPDRDGLRLDVLPLHVGPFFPRFPAGLVLDVKLAGDLILESSIRTPGIGEGQPFQHVRPALQPFVRALTEPVAIAELEMARARDHLRWLADALLAMELSSLGLRVLKLAQTVEPGDGDTVRGLARRLRWVQALGWATRGVGRIEADRLRGSGAGPVGRASGVDEDLRSADPAYKELGFTTILQDGGDAAARWRQRLEEAAQSLELAARAGNRRSRPTGYVESPRGRLEAANAPSTRLLEVVPELLAEKEWGDAVTTLVSLDLDLEEMVAAGIKPAVETTL
jgi:hypothetical protein